MTSRKRSFFTLIELLVVVAILSVLMALLLPALSRAKEMGRNAQCSGNLKQTGTAFMMYAQDWSDFLPRVWDGNSPTLWGVAIIDYLGSKHALACPSDSVNRDFQKRYAIQWWGYLNYSYGCNWTLDPVVGSRLFTEINWVHKLSKIPRPSNTILAGDSLRSALMSRGDTLTDFWSIGNRHSGNANMVFADGHVASFKQTELFFSDMWYMH